MHNIHKTRLKIEALVYKAGKINVALEHAEKTTRYKKFKSDLQKGLFAQIEAVATPENINNLLLFVKGGESATFTKNVNETLMTSISVLLSKKSISNYVDLSAFLVWGGNHGGQAAMDKLGIDGVFGIKNEEVITFFNDHSRLIIDSVDDYSKRWISGQIQQGKINKLTPQQIAETLIDEGKGISKVRAARISITELAYAMGTVERQASQSYGIETMIWRTSKDELVCPICLPLNGEEGSVEGVFGDGYLIPAHPSCRCFYEDVIPKGWVIPQYPWIGE